MWNRVFVSEASENGLTDLKGSDLFEEKITYLIDMHANLAFIP